MSTFLKVSEVKLVNGGYLTNGSKLGDNAPINNDAFVAAQKRAEYICTFAKLAEGKDFKGKEAYSLETLKASVDAELASKATVFVKKPTKAKRKLQDGLAAEAMAFMNWEGESTKVDKMNEALQEFEILNDFENHGLFFEDGIVKLNKIYSIDEVVAAVKSTINLLD